MGEDQTQEVYASDWDTLSEPYHATQPENDLSTSSMGATGRDRAAYPEPYPFMIPQPTSEAPTGEVRIEQLLQRLDATAHKLVNADSTEILPLAMQDFLALCQAGRGLALIYPEGAAVCRVAIRQQVSEWLANLFAQEPRFWGSPPAAVELLPIAEKQQSATDTEVRDTLEAHLGSAGVQWYTWLPLVVGGRVEVVLIALATRAFPPALEREALRPALAVLGDLLSAALEQAQLRHLLARREHIGNEFITLASHELKSPLTVIKGYSQLLLRQARRGGNAGAVDVGGLEAINQQVGRMSNLVAELLDASRIERGVLEVQPQPIDLVALVQRVVSQRQRAQPDVQFDLLFDEPTLMVLADPMRMEQVLGHLLDNAVKFGRENGPVEVLIRRAPAASIPLAEVMRGANGQAEGKPVPAQSEVALVSVRDYGLGLPVEERVLLFTAFYRGPEQGLHRQFAGLGLGLYLSRYLMTRQQGYLWAEFPASERAGGSTFYFSLPLAAVS